MPQNFFITGMPKSGKTTLLSRIAGELRAHGLRVGGFLSPEEKAHGTRTGFYVMDMESGAVGLLADVNADGPKVSKYHVDIKSFESIALPAMKRFDSYDVILIDEIGRMELKSRRFSDALDRVIESHTPLIASLHSDFVERYAQDGEVIFLDETNREAAYADLVQRITAIGRKPPAGAGKKRAPKKAEKAKAPAKAAPAGKEGKRAGKKQKPAARREPEGVRGEGKKGIVERVKELLGF